MKNRAIAIVVCLLYLSMALVFGVVHDHQHDHGGPLGHHDDCAACQWQIVAGADVPNVAPLTFGCVLETRLVFFEPTPSHASSYSFSPSRAPPVTPA